MHTANFTLVIKTYEPKLVGYGTMMGAMSKGNARSTERKEQN